MRTTVAIGDTTTKELDTNLFDIFKVLVVGLVGFIKVVECDIPRREWRWLEIRILELIRHRAIGDDAYVIGRWVIKAIVESARYWVRAELIVLIFVSVSIAT